MDDWSACFGATSCERRLLNDTTPAEVVGGEEVEAEVTGGGGEAAPFQLEEYDDDATPAKGALLPGEPNEPGPAPEDGTWLYDDEVEANAGWMSLTISKGGSS